MLRLALAFLLVALPLRAETVVAGLSQNRVSITANFDGSEILIFGAVKRDSPPPSDAPLEVIVTVSGPLEPALVRKKDRRFGIWVNTEAVEIDRAPSFYAVATSAPLQDSLRAVEDLRHKITIPRAVRSVGAPMDVVNPERFTEALIRIRQDAGLYKRLEETVAFRDQTLFDMSLALPANLRAGAYTARILLTREGHVVDYYETKIDVQKVGLERFLYTLAHEKPLIYGLLSLAIAIAAGWMASAVFRYVRG